MHPSRRSEAHAQEVDESGIARIVAQRGRDETDEGTGVVGGGDDGAPDFEGRAVQVNAAEVEVGSRVKKTAGSATTNTRTKAAKAAALVPTLIKAVTGVGAPW